MSDQSFLIVTFERSGGSALAELIRGHTKSAAVLGTPFAQNGSWTHIRKEFFHTGDLDKCKKLMSKALDSATNLYHHVEDCQFELTLALVDVAEALNYNIIFLTRRDELTRTWLLQLPELTGYSGRETELYRPGAVLPRKLTRKQMKDAVEKFDAQIKLSYATQHALRHSRKPFTWLIYEELYSDNEDSTGVMINTVSELGYSPKLAHIQETLEKQDLRDQPFTEVLSQIVYSDRLEEELAQLHRSYTAPVIGEL